MAKEINRFIRRMLVFLILLVIVILILQVIYVKIVVGGESDSKKDFIV